MAHLSYHIPGKKRERTILLIPESHTLYLCPSSCGRRQGIRALKNGEAEHVSFLSFSQTDVALGDYLQQIIDGVAAVLEFVQPAPRVLTLFVNCIDDFLGTDGDALVAELESLHPETRFFLSHINPIAQDVTGVPPAQGMQANLYAALEPVAAEQRDCGVNLLGSFAVPSRTCELFDVLEAAGTPANAVRSLPTCATFDEYQAMARSRYALLMGHMADAAARQMEERLGIAWMDWTPCYDLDEISRRYEALWQALGCAGELPAVVGERRERARQATGRAAAAVGDMPVLVDTAASMMPFSLARALLKWGLNVRAVFALHSKGWDEPARQALAAEHPEVEIVLDQGVEAIQGIAVSEPCLSVGEDAAFIVRAPHMVDLFHDEGCCGFEGVERLAQMVAEAMAEEKRWEV